MFWWIVLAVVVVGFTLAWWSSGRQPGILGRRQKIDPARVQGDAMRKHGSPGGAGGPGVPGGGGPSRRRDLDRVPGTGLEQPGLRAALGEQPGEVGERSVHPGESDRPRTRVGAASRSGSAAPRADGPAGRPRPPRRGPCGRRRAADPTRRSAATPRRPVRRRAPAGRPSRGRGWCPRRTRRCRPCPGSGDRRWRSGGAASGGRRGRHAPGGPRRRRRRRRRAHPGPDTVGEVHHRRAHPARDPAGVRGAVSTGVPRTRRRDGRSAWSRWRCEISTASGSRQASGSGRGRAGGAIPACRPRSGSVSRRTPSMSITTVACPSQVSRIIQVRGLRMRRPAGVRTRRSHPSGCPDEASREDPAHHRSSSPSRRRLHGDAPPLTGSAGSGRAARSSGPRTHHPRASR